MANTFEPTGTKTTFTISEMISGLTYTDSPGSAPFIQYWDDLKGGLKTAYYLDYVWDSESGEEWEPGWGDDETNVDRKEFGPGEGFWLRIASGPQTVTFAGQVVSLTEAPITLTTSWQLVGNPFPVSCKLNDASIDCAGLIATDNPGTAPFIQYWDKTKSGLMTAYYLDYVWDPDSGEEWEPGWGNDETVVDNHVFDPCDGFWARTSSGTGIIKFKR